MALKTYWRQLAMVFSAQIWHLFLWNGDCSLKTHIFLGSDDHEWEVPTVWAWRFSKLKPWAQLKKRSAFQYQQQRQAITSIESSLNLLTKFQAILLREGYLAPMGCSAWCLFRVLKEARKEGKRELGPSWPKIYFVSKFWSHPGLRQDLETKFAVIFHNYGLELTQVQDQYEKYKTGTKTQNLWRTKNLQRNAGCGHVPDKIHQRKVLASQEKFRCQAHRWCETFLQLLDTSLGLDTSTGPSESWKLGSMVVYHTEVYRPEQFLGTFPLWTQ